jgi:hypothetical protein
MSKAREMAEILSTPPAIYSTDAEVAATYLTQSSASTTYQGSPYRNLIINGDMQVAQRSSSVASITTGGYYTADRWRFGPSNMGTWTISQENDAPTGSGFRKSAKLLCTTADASPASNDHIVFVTILEGQNVQQIAKGTSSAKQLTLSFWVKSNVTGTYIANIYDNDNTRWCSASYAISASATWEKKTITLPADTTGAFDNDNEASLVLHMFLGAGTGLSSGTLGTTWRSADFLNSNIAVGQVNLASAISNYWQITGVQLEVGNVATPFEFKPIDIELAECQRYYIKFNESVGFIGGAAGNSNNSTLGRTLPVVMRASPTMSHQNTRTTDYYTAGGTNSALTSWHVQPHCAFVVATHGNLYGGGRQVVYLESSGGTSYVEYSIEL